MSELELSGELTNRLGESFKKILKELCEERHVDYKKLSLAVIDQMLANFSIRVLFGTSRAYKLKEDDLQKRIETICKALNISVNFWREMNYE